SGEIEAGLVVGIASCTPTDLNPDGCVPPKDGGIGTILFSGLWDPKWRKEVPKLLPHQNFTLKLPADIQKGRAQLSLTQFKL
ncbi:hypothetical protein L218DRAFT_846556, partial [Marasmius fiardii PR-910]